MGADSPSFIPDNNKMGLEEAQNEAIIVSEFADKKAGEQKPTGGDYQYASQQVDIEKTEDATKIAELRLGLSNTVNADDILVQKGAEIGDNTKAREGLGALSDGVQIGEFLKNNREDVDYAGIWDHQTPVLFVGERHTLKTDKEEIINNMQTYKENGMTHLAMEMIRQDQQEIIDRYLNDEVPRENVLSIFKESWDKREGIAEKYMEIVDQAKSLQIKVLGLDLDISNQNFSESFRSRNEKWASIIGATLGGNKESRILVFCGAAHAGYNMVHDTANEILASRGINSKVMEFSGGEKVKDAYALGEKISLSAQDLDINQENFMVNIDSRDPVKPADCIIHLPQTESPGLF